MAPASRGCLWTLKKWRRCTSSLIFQRSATTSTPSIPPITIKLREYQEECIQAVLANLGQGHKRLGISLATGAGKTVIFTQLIDRVQPRAEDADQTLILAHRQELVEQAARHCTNAYPRKRVEIEMGSMHASGFADITVASVQSIISGDRLDKFDPSRFKLVLVDEAHHIVAPGYMKTLQHFGLEEKRTNSPALVGVSATLSRFDGLKLGAAIDQVVYHKDYIDMIGEKWLSDVVFTTVQTKADISKVKKGPSGDFQSSELSKVINTESINDLTVRSWFEKAQSRKSTLAFCVDLDHVSGLTNTFRKYGIDARFVTGDTPKVERSQRLDEFRRGEFKVLVNCGVFTEGTDVPNIDCVLLARPTKSRNLLVQMIGRGMRLHPGKKDCHVIDMVASLETGIITSPTLFGLDPQELVQEATVQDMKTIQERKDAEKQREKAAGKVRSISTDAGPIIKKVTFTDYDSVFDLINDTSSEKNIRQLSPFSWVCVSEDKYVLTNSNGSYLKVEPNPDGQGYIVMETPILAKILTGTMSKSPFMRPRKIANSNTLLDAIHAADTYASKKFPVKFISKNQAWRNSPATEGQIIFLNKLRTKDDKLTSTTLTKGKAADMITKIKHGARGRFSSLESSRRKESKALLRLEQEQALRAREKVSVGPLLD